MEEGEGRNPVMSRRRLLSELRAARDEAELTQDYVARQMDWSLSKIIRIESGQIGISKNDLIAVLRLYGITDAKRVAWFVDLARMARERSLLRKYRDVAPAPFLELVEIEGDARVCRSYEAQLIPGMFQTEEYAHQVLRQFFREKRSKADDETIDWLTDLGIEFRLKRQEILDRARHPQYYMVIDEAAIRRVVGGQSVMRDQLRKLAQIAERPDITIEVIKFSAGIYKNLGAPFFLLEFPNASEDTVYLERWSEGDAIFRNDVEEIVHYREVFAKLRDLSLGESSAEFINEVADEFARN